MSDDATQLPGTTEEWFQFARDNIMRIRTDPVWFFKTAFGIKLDIWQEEMFDALADPIRHHFGLPTKINHPSPVTDNKPKQKFTVRAMHGPGKTFGAAAAIIWFHTAFKGFSPATAPTIKQLKNRLWPNIRKIQAMGDDFWRTVFEVRTTEVEWYGDPNWKCVAETGATPENLQGYHDLFMLIVCDEASGIDEAMFPVIEGALSTGIIVLLLLIGNPTKIQGTFADSHLKPKVSKYYHQIHVNLAKTTRVNPAWVKEMGEKYGITSPVYQVRCLGEFAEEDENQLMSLSWLESARLRDFRPDGSIPRRRITVDVADGGRNFTVITHSIRYNSFTLFVKQTQHSFPAGRATTMARKEAVKMWMAEGMSAENGDDIVVDSLGVGAGVTSELAELSYPVIRYQGGARSDDINRWRNRRVQSFMVLRDGFRDGLFAFAEDFVDEDEWDDLYAQLCTIKRKPGVEKVEDLLTKQEMINAGVVSPDRADSLAMQCATQAPMLALGAVGQIITLGRQMETAGYDGSIAQ
jgi:phage terminase large subunit